MQMLQADYLLCLDSDGQYDPRDFWSFWNLRSDYDLIIGWRVKRADTLLRRTFSRFFFLIYQTVLRIPVHDPSCPFVLVKKTVAHEIVGKPGTMKEASGGSLSPDSIAAATESKSYRYITGSASPFPAPYGGDLPHLG
jgi:glycosyltransferase involved in cell wall biosynthesis